MAAISTGMAPMQQNYASIACFGKDGAGRVEQSEQPVSPPESPQKPLHDERRRSKSADTAWGSHGSETAHAAKRERFAALWGCTIAWGQKDPGCG